MAQTTYHQLMTWTLNLRYLSFSSPLITPNFSSYFVTLSTPLHSLSTLIFLQQRKGLFWRLIVIKWSTQTIYRYILSSYLVARFTSLHSLSKLNFLQQRKLHRLINTYLYFYTGWIFLCTRLLYSECFSVMAYQMHVAEIFTLQWWIGLQFWRNFNTCIFGTFHSDWSLLTSWVVVSALTSITSFSPVFSCGTMWSVERQKGVTTSYLHTQLDPFASNLTFLWQLQWLRKIQICFPLLVQ